MSLIIKLERRVTYANKINERLSELNIEGVPKLINKVKQETKFLKKSFFKRKLKKQQLLCSNLKYLEAVAIQVLENEEICRSVMKPKILKKEDGSTKKIFIDLILSGGTTWMKVISRNKRALSLNAKGQHSRPRNRKTILDQANEMLQCSHQNLCYYQPPVVTFYFADGIDDSLAADLANLGIKVEKQLPETNGSAIPPRIPKMGPAVPPLKDISTAEDVDIINKLCLTKLNLGVTAMVAYVSALTNGGCNSAYQADIIKKHAEWEKSRSVKEILDKLFVGKELYTCQTALNEFIDILSSSGGAQERERAEEFLQRVKIVEDHPSTQLKPSSKIKERSIAIFGTGEYLKAVTVTANKTFVRSAMNQGVNFQVFLHESRPLAEKKQIS